MNDPYLKAEDAVICPECGNIPADSRVLAKTDLGAGIEEQAIFCDRCKTAYTVMLAVVQ